MKKIVSLLVILVLPVLVFAHEGHGIGEGTAIHYVTSLVHLIPVAVTLFLVSYLVKLFKKNHQFKN